jgi:hypothetical protein
MEPSSSGRPTRSLPKQRSSAEFPPNERVRCPCRDDGGGEIVRFFARLDLGTAFATLIRQRHPMPSCGGLAPTAERTVDPARMIEESLTSDPGIREQNRHQRDPLPTPANVCSLGTTRRVADLPLPPSLTHFGHHPSGTPARRMPAQTRSRPAR